MKFAGEDRSPDQAGSRLLGPFRRQVVADPKPQVRTLETREEPPGTVVTDCATATIRLISSLFLTA